MPDKMTEKMRQAFFNAMADYQQYREKEQHHGRGWKTLPDYVYERILSAAAPTPPEDGPVAWINFTQSPYAPLDLHFQFQNPHDERWTPVYTSPLSPKAEWSESGEPLNLEAAAQYVIDVYETTQDWRFMYSIKQLRKFTKEES